MAYTPTNWIGYWDDAPTVYVSAHHKTVHYKSIADGILARVPYPGARVLDFGCGEALSADKVAARCERLYLSDAASSVRDGLRSRFSGNAKIAVVGTERLDSEIPQGTLDLIVVNSVAQYLTPTALADSIGSFRPLLAPQGEILFADIIPPDVSAIADARALLAMALRHGFLAQALIGLGRTYFSNYRTLRNELGLTQYSAAAFVELLASRGLDARRVRPNLGHNQRRMAFLARLSADA